MARQQPNFISAIQASMVVPATAIYVGLEPALKLWDTIGGFFLGRYLCSVVFIVPDLYKEKDRTCPIPPTSGGVGIFHFQIGDFLLLFSLFYDISNIRNQQ